ncbi:hypothetical protein MP228_011253 [Amoeboaphelidium protococcarum]|nr:hypothetical protein MP228_011253 [Amoeboaphelidium protococcarum]
MFIFWSRLICLAVVVLSWANHSMSSPVIQSSAELDVRNLDGNFVFSPVDEHDLGALQSIAQISECPICSYKFHADQMLTPCCQPVCSQCATKLAKTSELCEFCRRPRNSQSEQSVITQILDEVQNVLNWSRDILSKDSDQYAPDLTWLNLYLAIRFQLTAASKNLQFLDASRIVNLPGRDLGEEFDYLPFTITNTGSALHQSLKKFRQALHRLKVQESVVISNTRLEQAIDQIKSSELTSSQRRRFLKNYFSYELIDQKIIMSGLSLALQKAFEECKQVLIDRQKLRLDRQAQLARSDGYLRFSPLFDPGVYFDDNRED